MSVIESWKDDPEVIAAIEFLHEVKEPTLENIRKILDKLATYAYKPDKTSGDYQDMFFLIAHARIKCEDLIEKQSESNE